MQTPMAAEHVARMTPEQVQALRARQREQIAIGGKPGDPDTDLAPVMVFLAAEGSRFITGQIIAVNGGLDSVR
jgi:NAD(P)-dependent dehydrogenase (short-subunit alcohol dehydrogenase family)